MQLECAGSPLEAAEARANVVEEAGLAHLAVVDHVDADRQLTLDDVCHRTLHPALERVLLRVGQRLGLTPREERPQVRRLAQRTGVRRENSLSAPLHRGHATTTTLHDGAIVQRGTEWITASSSMAPST